ncbi:hypothetical protein DSO57_1003372 [Entomophthora muscae]|uniref:Uncharacterized protein n=1 Tax=Entomophthora muscae TaxID=34485 RepID=A0ACC2SXJ3_9FUNG|nr:hypothetical protein DSO57_1003372 [Entomophthora muscae]
MQKICSRKVDITKTSNHEKKETTSKAPKDNLALKFIKTETDVSTPKAQPALEAKFELYVVLDVGNPMLILLSECQRSLFKKLKLNQSSQQGKKLEESPTKESTKPPAAQCLSLLTTQIV